MKIIKRTLWLLLLCAFGSACSGTAFGAPGPAPGTVEKTAPAPNREADVALCYLGEAGFMVAPPEGWVNLREAADTFGLCALYVPEGYDFDTAPAVIYPNVVERGGSSAPVEEQAARMLGVLRSRPGGDAVKALPGEPFTSAFGVEFQLRYFNDAPAPNNFELAAYHAQGGAMLIMVLSAMTEQDHRVYLGDFMSVLDGVITMKVRDKTGGEKAAE